VDLTKPRVTRVPFGSESTVASDVALFATARLWRDAKALDESVVTLVAPAESDPEKTPLPALTDPATVAFVPTEIDEVRAKVAAEAALVTCNEFNVATDDDWSVENDPRPVAVTDVAENAPAEAVAIVVEPWKTAEPLTVTVLRLLLVETTRLFRVDPWLTWRVDWSVVPF
jgi:hypothetical protein